MLASLYDLHLPLKWYTKKVHNAHQGREMFLATRSGVIKRRIRQLTFEGDVTTYINELSLVVFTLVRNTCEWYRDSFKDNRMASGEPSTFGMTKSNIILTEFACRFYYLGKGANYHLRSDFQQTSIWSKFS
jgi:Exocyst component 84 C-terminal